jgi:hypothetical protein
MVLLRRLFDGFAFSDWCLLGHRLLNVRPDSCGHAVLQLRILRGVVRNFDIEILFLALVRDAEHDIGCVAGRTDLADHSFEFLRAECIDRKDSAITDRELRESFVFIENARSPRAAFDQ